jgi:hypothetical protein
MNCKHCSEPLMVDMCVNIECGYKGKKSTAAPRRSQTKRRNRRRVSRPDPSMPIPNKVNSREYAPHQTGLTSLLGYFKYSRAKECDFEQRCESLDFIINAGPFIPSNGNRPYIKSFGPPNSRERIEAIINQLQRLLNGIWFVRKHPDNHKSKIPAMEKAEEDLRWLQSKL